MVCGQGIPRPRAFERPGRGRGVPRVLETLLVAPAIVRHYKAAGLVFS